MTLPNFIGIGAQRAATTWMYHCLREHPEIFASEKKELHFFDENFEKGIEWYAQHFESAGKPVISEITPNYLNVEIALERMAKTVPDARLFVVLREPISRAYSSYRLLHNEHFQGKSFQEACEISPYLTRLSKYSEDLARVYSLYQSDQVKVFLYDDVLSDPADVVRQLYSFAQVDADFVPESIDVRYNPILYPRVQDTLEKFKLGRALARFKQTRLGVHLKNRLSTQKTVQTHSDDNTENKKRIASEAYIQSLKQEFRQDILKVQDMIGRDLSAWL